MEVAHLNPFLNAKIVEPKAKRQKTHDVKIPVNLEVYEYLKDRACLRNVSITKITSLIMNETLSRTHSYTQIEYVPYEENMVHAYITTENYQYLRRLSYDWNCSIREAAFTVLQTGIRAVNL